MYVGNLSGTFYETIKGWFYEFRSVNFRKANGTHYRRKAVRSIGGGFPIVFNAGFSGWLNAS